MFLGFCDSLSRSDSDDTFRSQPPQKFWALPYVRTQQEISNQILHSDQTRCEENFTASTTPLVRAKVFADARSACGG